MTAPTIRLLSIDGTLYFPYGGHTWGDLTPRADEPALLIRYYPEGDVDTIPWPMDERHTERLAIALFDQRECNAYFPGDALIELPDGSPFDF
jgi:hypothetical protein